MADTHLMLIVKNAPDAQTVASHLRALAATDGLATTQLPFGEIPATVAPNTIACVVGGDGTFLSAARQLYGFNVPMVGINCGHLGFLTEINAQDIPTQLKAFLTQNCTDELRPYFQCTITRNGQDVCTEPFINDAVLLRDATAKMIPFELRVRNRLVTAHGRADGMIISTPTGSTAYNLSTGGPILHPALPGLVLAPICPHKLSFRPVVIPDWPVSLMLQGERNAHLSLDGRENLNIHPGDELHIRRAPHALRLRHLHPPHFFSLLREKLGWEI